MAEEKRAAPGDKPRRRPAPTIDLTATEVSASKPPDPAPEAPPAERDMQKTQNESAARSSILMPAVVGAIAGAVLVFASLWVAGVVQFGDKRSDDISPRLASLERQIRDLAQRPQPQPDSKAIDSLAQRIDKVEQAAGKPVVVSDNSLTERVGVLEAGLTAVNRRVEGLQTTIQQTPATQPALDRLSQRLDALEQNAKATQDKIAQNSGTDAAARQALAAFALRDAVARNAPYGPELAAVKKAGGDAQPIAALEPFAASGLASDAALSRELAALVPSMIKVTETDTSRSGGFVERLQANASKLVRIQPIGEPAGEDAVAVVARLEVKLARNDVAGAQQELAALPPRARDIAEPWSKKLTARNAALAASRKLAADSAAALAR
jgi:hypothetical protein